MKTTKRILDNMAAQTNNTNAVRIGSGGSLKTVKAETAQPAPQGSFLASFAPKMPWQR